MKNRKSPTHLLAIALGFAVMSALTTGCGKSTADIAISSDPVAFTGAAGRIDPGSSLMSLAGIGSSALTDTTDFSFCVRRVKLEGEDDQPVKKDDETGMNGEKDPDDISFAPGLITIEPNVAVNWGVANIPVGFKLKRIKIKVHKDQDLCGVNYSVKYNGVSQTEDIEFKFRFEPALDLDSDTSAIAVSLDSVVTALRNAGEVGVNQIKSIIEGAEGSARQK
ncbi:MAG: hypothetical protein NDJ89_00040 [Oligoflexia bacterium]|nr:hypothetical protein [Oligoflexia bacterium]